MDPRDWVDVPVIQGVSRHLSGVVAVLIAFLIVGAIISLLRDGLLKQVLEIVEGGILVGLVVILAVKLFDLLIRGNRGSHFLVS